MVQLLREPGTTRLINLDHVVTIDFQERGRLLDEVKDVYEPKLTIHLIKGPESRLWGSPARDLYRRLSGHAIGIEELEARNERLSQEIAAMAKTMIAMGRSLTLMETIAHRLTRSFLERSRQLEGHRDHRSFLISSIAGALQVSRQLIERALPPEERWEHTSPVVDAPRGPDDPDACEGLDGPIEEEGEPIDDSDYEPDCDDVDTDDVDDDLVDQLVDDNNEPLDCATVPAVAERADFQPEDDDGPWKEEFPSDMVPGDVRIPCNLEEAWELSVRPQLNQWVPGFAPPFAALAGTG